MIAEAEQASSLAPRIEIVATDERFAEIGGAWEALWRRTEGLIFQDWAWVDAWRRTDPHRASRRLLVGLLWKGDRLDAVLALAIVRRSGLRVLEWAAKEHSDFCDILVAPGCDAAELRRLWRETLGAGGYDLVYLNRLLPDAAVSDLLREPAPVPLAPSARFERNYKVQGDWTDGESWFKAQPKKTRQNDRRGRSAIEETGQTVSFRLLDPAEPLGPLLERVAALKRGWMERSGNASDLFDEGSPALGALVDVMAKRGVLRVFVEECDGVAISIAINLQQRGKMMCFVNAYDPAFERGSPGILLLIDTIRWSFDQGLSEVDFLCGGEEYKRRIATDELTLRSVMGARTLLGRLAILGEANLRRFKTWRATRAAKT